MCPLQPKAEALALKLLIFIYFQVFFIYYQASLTYILNQIWIICSIYQKLEVLGIFYSQVIYTLLILAADAHLYDHSTHSEIKQ